MSDREPDVSEPSREYLAMEELRELPRLYRGGDSAIVSRALSDAGLGGSSVVPSGLPGASDFNHLQSRVTTTRRPLLVKHPAETDEDFRARVYMLQWWDPYWTAAEDLGRKPFSRDVTLDGVPKEMEGWLEDVDGVGAEGRDLRRFAADTCVESVGYGMGYLYVSWEESLGRPIIQMIPASSVFHVDRDPDTGATRIRVSTVRVIKSKWGSKEIPQVTVFYDRRGREGSPSVERHERRDPNDPSSPWVVAEDRKPLRGSYMPIVPLPTGYVSPHFSPPAMGTLGALTRVHLNKLSRLDWILLTANVPIRFASGITKAEMDEQRKLGPKTTWWSAQENAKIVYVEHEGKAIGRGLEDLDRCERRLEVLRKSPLVTRVRGNETATSIRRESSSAETQAEAWAVGWADSFSQALRVMASMASFDSESVSVDFWHDFGIGGDSLEAFGLIQKAYLDGGITAERYFVEGKRYGIYGDDLDPQKEALLVEAMKSKRVKDLSLSLSMGSEEPDDQRGEMDPEDMNGNGMPSLGRGEMRRGAPRGSSASPS